MILKTYRFLQEEERKKIGIDYVKSDASISKEIHEKIDKHWAIQKTKQVEQTAYEEMKRKEIEEKADFQLVFAAMNIKESIIVTEESKSVNDKKLFKKIPLICEHEKIPCIALPEMLKKVGIGIEYKTK